MTLDDGDWARRRRGFHPAMGFVELALVLGVAFAIMGYVLGWFE